jgi:hypothetical protein
MPVFEAVAVASLANADVRKSFAKRTPFTGHQVRVIKYIYFKILRIQSSMHLQLDWLTLKT